jgi:hypothetical protein
MNTHPLIASCGLDCSTCDARIATLTDDNILRQKTADLWKEAHNADITADMINCTGCREAGAKIGYCSVCEIRNCAIEKQFTTCGECKELNDCSIVRKVHSIVPEALENLLKTN